MKEKAKKQNKFINWFKMNWELVMLGAIIVAAIVFLLFVNADYTNRVDACEARGGVYLDPYCLNLEEL